MFYEKFICMNYLGLKQGIKSLSDTFRQNAVVAVNAHLTVRNWLVGFYIIEYEQNGEDRAKYGARLLQNLSDELNEDGFSYRNLKLYRLFYQRYPQIGAYIPQFFKSQFGNIRQSVITQFDNSTKIEHTIPVEKLIQRLSFTHLTLLFSIDNPLKRLFYEIECIKGTWSVRELRRQIDSLYFERSGMSQNPALLSRIVQESSEAGNMLDTIKSPFTFEFLGLKAKDVVYESDLEQALIEHLEDFLMELGYGFCFEARQKRIIIGGEYFFCDLVFYHRVLKCHVLAEIKVGSFSHEHIGQLKTYINYFRKEVMRPDDNPPVGILLVTNKNSALVEYAVAESDTDIFVSKYLLELPTKEQLIHFVNDEFSRIL